MPTPEEIQQALAVLDASDAHRVLHAAHVPTSATESADVASAVVLDTETTGLHPSSEKIIELGIVPFRYDRGTGAILETGAALSAFEDPGKPIPPEVVELTGITDDDVAGQSFDDAAVRAMLDGADLIIAHNAGFDRPFVDRRFDFARGKAWADSVSEVPWSKQGQECRKLGCLLKNHAKMFFTGHRAATDAAAILSLLATPFDDGSSPMQALLASARAKSYRIEAYGSPFETKDALKARRYRWNQASKVWWIDRGADELDDEIAWLETEVYGGQSGRHVVTTFTATTRYAEGK